MSTADSLYGALPSCCRTWRIDDTTDGRLQASADYAFPASYVGFAGHFPGRPILPAIVQLAAVRHLAECAVGQKLLPHRYEKARFKVPIAPDEPVKCTLVLTRGEAGWRGSFKLVRPGGEPVASGLIEFSVEPR